MPPVVKGLGLDAHTRCAHYASALDVIAIRHYCCGEYYACVHCHDALAGHPSQPWPLTLQDTRAVLCGHCGYELTIAEYLACGSRCPACQAGFNPRCSVHYPSYFETPKSPE